MEMVKKPTTSREAYDIGAQLERSEFVEMLNDAYKITISRYNMLTITSQFNVIVEKHPAETEYKIKNKTILMEAHGLMFSLKNSHIEDALILRYDNESVDIPLVDRYCSQIFDSHVAAPDIVTIAVSKVRVMC